MLKTKQTEIGKPIKNFKRLYEVSNYGRISNYRKIMKTYKINSGYLSVKFTKNGVRSHHLVHRLVAETFIPNPDNKREVNHIDGDKTNNCVDNLEWVSSSENKQHAIQSGLTVYNVPTLGKKIGKGSKFHNVVYDRTRKKFIGTVRHNGKNWYQKRFSNEIDAAMHVNWILDKLQLDDRPRNFV